MAKEIKDTLDLSKVANLGAIEKMDPSFKVNKSDTGLFPTEYDRIQLPSGGKPYKNMTEDPDILTGFIVLREMKGHDEKVLSNPKYIKDGTVYRRILENCIKSAIKPEDLITTDFNYTLFALRGFSYGDEYSFTAKCQNALCSKEFAVDILISELQWNELPEDFKEPIKIKLPRTKHVIECIMPRQYHVELLRQDQMKNGKGDSDNALIKKFVYTTISIKDEDGNEVQEGANKMNWYKFFSDLPVKDLAELRDKTKFNTDVEEKETVCSHCGETQNVGIPIGTEFFRF